MPEEEFKQQTSKEADFSQVQYLIFDRDGTLFDSQETYTQVFCELLQQNFGIDSEKARKYYLETFGKHLGAQFQEAVFKFAGQQIKSEELEAAFWDLVKEEPAKLLHGAAETLKELKRRGYKIAVWTNARLDVLEAKTKEFGLDRFVDFQISEAIGGGRETKGPVLFERVAKHFGITPAVLSHKAVVIGDGERDIEAGNLCNALTIGITTGTKGEEELRNAGAKLIINRLPELLEILKR